MKHCSNKHLICIQLLQVIINIYVSGCATYLTQPHGGAVIERKDTSLHNDERLKTLA